MDWKFVVALAVAVPVILFPAAVVWYISVGGVFKSIKRKTKNKAAGNMISKTGK